MKRYINAAWLVASVVCNTAAFAGGVLRLDESPIGELDPAKALDTADSILMFNVYDSLLIPKAGTTDFEPLLAKKWKTSDNIHYTFDLRNDVKFHSGDLLTSEDVVFSFKRMMALGQGFSYLYSNVESVKAVDNDTVIFTLKQPYSPFLSSLVHLPIIDKDLVMSHLGKGDGEMKDWGQTYLNLNDAGSGAYTISSHNPQSETVMQKNPDYFLPIQSKAPDTVRMRYGLEPSTVRTLMKQGKHDISSQWLPPEVLKSLANDGMQLLHQQGAAEFYIKLNTAEAPFDDVECRLAVANAFDYASGIKMVEVTKGISQGSDATGAIPQGMLGSLPKTDEFVYKQNLEAAKAHLAKCRYKPSDMDIELSWIAEVPLEKRFALLMQANLAQIGLKATIRKVPWAMFTELVTKPETTPSVSQVFISSVTGDPDSILYAAYHSSKSGTWLSPEYLKDEKVDELLEKGRKVSQSERTEVYQELNKRLRKLAPAIFAQDQISVFAASPRVHAPALSEPGQGYTVDGFGFNFRFIEVD